jgi:surface antigen
MRAAAAAALALALALAGCETAFERVNGALLPDLHEGIPPGDARIAARALSEALETRPHGEAVSWSGTESGHSGSFRPTRTVQVQSGRFCRDFVETLRTPDDRRASYELTACRSPGGAWLVR